MTATVRRGRGCLSVEVGAARVAAVVWLVGCGSPGSGGSSPHVQARAVDAAGGLGSTTPGDDAVVGGAAPDSVPDVGTPVADAGTTESADGGPLPDVETADSAAEAVPVEDAPPSDPLRAIHVGYFCSDPEVEEQRDMVQERLSRPFRFGGQLCGSSSVSARYVTVRIGRHQVTGLSWVDYSELASDGPVEHGSALLLDDEILSDDEGDAADRLWRRLRRPMDLTLEQAAGLAVAVFMAQGWDGEKSPDFRPSSNDAEQARFLRERPSSVRREEDRFVVEMWSEFSRRQSDPRPTSIPDCRYVVRYTAVLQSSSFRVQHERWVLEGEDSCGRPIPTEEQ